MLGGPYISVTDYNHNGCNASPAQVNSVYIYPADGSCFIPTGGNSYRGSWGHTISIINSTAVNITEYFDNACTDLWHSYIEPVGACPSQGAWFEISIFQTMPSNEYWLNQGYIGYLGPWETLLALDYYSYLCENSTWVDRQIVGWPICSNSGQYYYCKNNEIHYESCMDSAECSYECFRGYEPLSDACSATLYAPEYWSSFIDPSSSFYQASCVGGYPIYPSSTPSPSRAPSPSASPSAVPNDDSSSDEPSEGVWVLLLIIAFLVGIIIGLFVGFAIYSKVM